MTKEKSYTGFADHELFRLLVDRVKDYAIFALDPRGHVVTWNAGAELLKGYRAEDIIGEHIERFYMEEDRRDGKPRRYNDCEMKTCIYEGKRDAALVKRTKPQPSLNSVFMFVVSKPELYTGGMTP